MLDAKLKTQLKAYLERVSRPVEIVASLDDGDASVKMRTLLDEVVSLSPLLSLVERRDGVERTPSFAIGRAGEAARVRFAGIPLGHEFTSLVLALLQAGGHPPKVEADVLEQVRGLEGELVFETYVSLSCQNCPDVVQALNLMAVGEPERAPHDGRRRAVPGRGRGAPHHGGTDRVPQRPGIRARGG